MRGCQSSTLRTAGRLPDGRDLSRKTRSQGIMRRPRQPGGGADAGSRATARTRSCSTNRALARLRAPVWTRLLRNLGIAHVILCGVSYDAGVESTMRSATDRGYGLVLVPDACASFDETQQAGLWQMESGTIQVRSAAALADWIATL